MVNGGFEPRQFGSRQMLNIFVQLTGKQGWWKGGRNGKDDGYKRGRCEREIGRCRKKGKSMRQEILPESEIKTGHLEESYLREL